MFSMSFDMPLSHLIELVGKLVFGGLAIVFAEAADGVATQVQL